MQSDIAPSASEPVPLNHLTLPEVVAELAAKITNHDIKMAPPPAALQALFGPFEWAPVIGFGNNAECLVPWLKSEQAIFETAQALADGSLPAIIWDPVVCTYVRLLPEDWRQATFQDQMVRGGAIRSLAGEHIGSHEGARPLIAKADLIKQLSRRQRSRTPAAEKKCANWLEYEMRVSPEQAPHRKPYYCREAVDNFGISHRRFNAIWKAAILKTGASWNRRGRPSETVRCEPTAQGADGRDFGVKTEIDQA